MADQKLKRWSGAEAWAQLPAEQREEIGATALEIVMAWAVEEAFAGPGPHLPSDLLERACFRAVESGSGALLDLLRDQVSEAAGIRAEPEAVALPSLLGRICSRCGCSDLDACADGCGWAGEDLCTSCAGAADASTEGGPC